MASLFSLSNAVLSLDSFDNDSTLEVLSFINDESPDFEVNDHRFIRVDAIDHIQVEELGCDEYVLGCFNASFLAEILEIDVCVIEAMQNSEAFDAVGKLVISLNKLDAVQEGYKSADGYGHHFAHYDHNEHEIGADYLAFRIN